MIKIIVENNTGIIKFSGIDILLNEHICIGDNFRSSNITTANYTLYEVESLPNNFINNYFTYNSGEIEIIPEKMSGYNRIINPVPQKISKRRAVLVLDDYGLYEPMMVELNKPENRRAKLVFDNSSEFWRTNDTLANLKDSLGLTEEQVDNMFIEAMGNQYD